MPTRAIGRLRGGAMGEAATPASFLAEEGGRAGAGTAARLRCPACSSAERLATREAAPYLLAVEPLITITRQDFERLRGLVGARAGEPHHRVAEQLETELERARVSRPATSPTT
jgi:hypothetical protein